MSEKRANWIWTVLRRKGRRDLDRIQRDLVVGRHERREFAGDPQQSEQLKIRLRKK
jgi:hypothetical protein